MMSFIVRTLIFMVTKTQELTQVLMSRPPVDFNVLVAACQGISAQSHLKRPEGKSAASFT